MKRLLILITIALFAGGPRAFPAPDAILIAMIQGDMSTYDGRYEKFNDGKGTYSAYRPSGVEILDRVLPPAAKWSARPDGTQKTVREWVIPHLMVTSLDGTQVTLPLCGMQWPGGRDKPTTIASMILWDYYLELNGFSMDSWITKQEWQALIRTEAYYVQNPAEIPVPDEEPIEE